MERKEQISVGRIAVFWMPLAATWLMMAYEGPFLTALIARVANPEINLAAWGVAFAFAIIIEAPIIMIMSAATALVNDRQAYLKLRNFTNFMNAGLTLVMLLLLFTPLYEFVMYRLIGLPDEVGRLTHTSLIILLPWPGAIGIRRFYQGLLIRNGQTKRVAYGTAMRLVVVTSVGLGFYIWGGLSGACMGAAAGSAGVIIEAIASRAMAQQAIESILKEDLQSDKSLGYLEIVRFYMPLALTSTLALAAQPMITFFVGHSRHSLESLAVLPVINGLSFVFRAFGISFQEVGIALIGEKAQNYYPLRRFGLILTFAVVGAFGLIAFTPLAPLWFQGVSGLSPGLAAFAKTPTMIMVLIPGFSVILSWQRAMLVNNKNTGPITWSTFIEVFVIAVVLYVAIDVLGIVGATAAAAALVVGRVFGSAYLALRLWR
jgi:progressive ankylosis protein